MPATPHPNYILVTPAAAQTAFGVANRGRQSGFSPIAWRTAKTFSTLPEMALSGKCWFVKTAAAEIFRYAALFLIRS